MGYTYDSALLAEQFEKFINCNWGEGEEDADINEMYIKRGLGDVVGIYNLDGHEILIQTDLCEDTLLQYICQKNDRRNAVLQIKKKQLKF